MLRPMACNMHVRGEDSVTAETSASILTVPWRTIKISKLNVDLFGSLTPASSLTEVVIAEEIVAVYQQPLTECKPQPTDNCKNCSSVCLRVCVCVCACHCERLSYSVQHRTVLSLSYPPDNHRDVY